MPNVLDADGLQTATREELLEYYTEKYQEIYGSDINLASDTPDGQMMNIQIQTVLDLQDLLVQIYNSFNPDTAIGKVLDQRVSINGIQRQAGTYTITPVAVTTDQTVNLYGLDQEDEEVYTVQDNAGTRWNLVTTVLGTGVGTTSYDFRAEDPGEILSLPNTITIPVTIVLGVTAVNNPTTYSTLGINEESDVLLKVRRSQSVSLASQGFLDGLLAALTNINGVTSAFVYENTGSTTDGDGVPGHSIWVIVAGTADDADIAQAIYTKRNAGAGMYGAESYFITQADDSLFEVNWDEVVTRNLFISFTATSIDGTTAVDIATIRAGIAADFTPGVYEEVNINAIATIAQQYDPNALITNAGLSKATTQTFALDGVAASGSFKISYNGEESAAIDWNDSIGTINTVVQAVTGLSSATVTGSIGSQSLVFDLSGVGNVEALIYVVDNSLQTGAAADIAFSYDEDYTDTLEPASKQNQFIVSTANIIIVAMRLVPILSQVATTATKQFTAYGGYGEYTFSISIDNSGASIDASTGEYTAGSTPSVTDTVLVTDALGNTATAQVQVV